MPHNLSHSITLFLHLVSGFLQIVHPLLLVLLGDGLDVLGLLFLLLLFDEGLAFLHSIDLVHDYIVDSAFKCGFLLVEGLFGLVGLFDDFYIFVVFDGG
jgi:hypothetical protein